MAKIRILLIEDNRLLREGIAAMLNGQSDLEVVARAEDGIKVFDVLLPAKVATLVYAVAAEFLFPVYIPILAAVIYITRL